MTAQVNNVVIEFPNWDALSEEKKQSERQRIYGEVYLAYEGKVRTAAVKAGFRGSDIDDAVQDVFMTLLASNYIERYNGSTTFATYFWLPVQRRLWTHKKQMSRRDDHDSLDAQLGDEDDRTLADKIPSKPIEEPSFIDEILEGVPDTYSTVSPKGEKRSLRLVARLLSQGWSKTEIAEYLGTSKTWITQCVKRLQDYVRYDEY